MSQYGKAQIIKNPAILAGKPVIAGTRMSVDLILARLASRWTMEEVVEAYPHIARGDILAALAFAANVLRRITVCHCCRD